jgi:hypothetical protein
MDAGTATALPPLARFTARPPLGAPEESVTVHVSVPAPTMDVFVHCRPERVEFVEEAPFPCSLAEVEDFAIVVTLVDATSS